VDEITQAMLQQGLDDLPVTTPMPYFAINIQIAASLRLGSTAIRLFMSHCN
jgi:hypothetical protein